MPEPLQEGHPNVLKRQCSPSKEEEEPKTKRPVVKKATLVELSMGDMKTFARQREAIEELKRLQNIWKDDLRIFSFELKSGNGERRYLVATLQRFWKWYKEQEERHMYELIYEDMPCRLYFDLEYSKDHNLDVDHKRIYDHFTSTLSAILRETFDISLDVDKDLLVLESSTEAKFSAHLICHLPNGTLFPNTMAIRGFSELLVKRLLENPPEKLRNSEGKEVPLLDAGVYSRNRNFRLFLSSKMGKTACLQLAPYCKFYAFRGIKNPCEMRIFLDSLCVPTEYHKCPLLDVKSPEEEHKVGPDPKMKSNSAGPLQVGRGASPLPHIDDFLTMVLQKWTANVYFREWKIVEKEGKISQISYYPGNCRYCFNIGREHKSNGTWWTVDVEKGHFYQKCFDPDCRGTSSNYFPLPDFVREARKPPAEGEEQESFLDASRVEVEKFFSDWDSVFDS